MSMNLSQKLDELQRGDRHLETTVALCEIRTQLKELTKSVESCQSEVSEVRNIFNSYNIYKQQKHNMFFLLFWTVIIFIRVACNINQLLVFTQACRQFHTKKTKKLRLKLSEKDIRMENMYARSLENIFFVFTKDNSYSVRNKNMRLSKHSIQRNPKGPQFFFCLFV
jgi:hypothetical protein